MTDHMKMVYAHMVIQGLVVVDERSSGTEIIFLSLSLSLSLSLIHSVFLFLPEKPQRNYVQLCLPFPSSSSPSSSVEQS